MSLLEILHYPDPRLRNKASTIECVDQSIRTIANDMLATMYAAHGIGLAAIQVNIRKRILVIDISEDGDQPLCIINPELIRTEGRAEYEEGCLSLPGITETVERAEYITVRALGIDGKPFDLDAEGLLGVCIQHEMDHLDGKLFIDYLSTYKRKRVKKRIEKERDQETS